LPAAAQKDAAEKVQEGNVNNWVEYYRQQRAPATTPGPGAAAAGEKPKAEREARDALSQPADAGRKAD